MLYNDFTIILPTVNESENVGELIRKLTDFYKGIFIIVSDDGSVDNTKNIISSFQDQRISFLDRRDKKIHGLAISILDASKMVKSKYFIVMDADSQHPWEKVEEIINNLKGKVKLVIASRKKVEGHWSIFRKGISYLGNTLGKISLLTRGKRYITYDVLTGFFGVETAFWKRLVFEENNFVHFRLKGYKVLFDFLKIIPNKTPVKNVSYVFNSRRTGFSKLNRKIYIEFLKALFS